MAHFGELLAELRQDRALMQRELAEVLHVTVGTISNYEQGVHLPDIEKLVNLADFFHVSTDYLLGRSGCSLSPNAFDEPLLEDKTIGDFICQLRRLPQDRRQIISTVIADMEFHTLVSQYDKKERQ